MKISAVVHPNAKKPRIEKDLLGTLHIYVHEPPLDGEANHATVLALAEYFHTKRQHVLLLHGSKSKQKVFEVAVP